MECLSHTIRIIGVDRGVHSGYVYWEQNSRCGVFVEMAEFQVMESGTVVCISVFGGLCIHECMCVCVCVWLEGHIDQEVDWPAVWNTETGEC